ncbi:MAG: hypothetical protein UW79_C0031G0003 [Candidatus Yanofskybacteria bacterium GW2011_GWA2_44_9]|nr:MAG: hypothetical protein UW79_C0031G0003 [Candidatus Yanofskybacteria bacterium GW2011_GWA2_44_9]
MTLKTIVQERSLEFIKQRGLSGYRKCTVAEIRNYFRGLSTYISAVSPGLELSIDENLIKEALNDLETQGKIFRITTEIGDCFALRTNPSQVTALF